MRQGIAKNAQVREALAVSLGEGGDGSACVVLQDFLSDTEIPVRRAASASLEKIREYPKNAMERASFWLRRREATYILAEKDAFDTLSDLAQKNLGEEEIGLRLSAIQCLGTLGDKRALPILTAMRSGLKPGLAGRGGRGVLDDLLCNSIAKAIGEMGDTLEAVKAAVCENKEISAEAIQKIRIRASPHEAISIDLWADNFDALVNLDGEERKCVSAYYSSVLHDSKSYLDKKAKGIEYFGHIGDASAVSILSERLTGEPFHDGVISPGWLETKVVAALGAIGNDAIPVLVVGLQHRFAEVREAVCAELIRLEWHPDTEIEQASYYVALGRFEALQTIGEKAVPVLEAALEFHVPPLEKIVSTLAGIPCERATTLLREIVSRYERYRHKGNLIWSWGTAIELLSQQGDLSFLEHFLAAYAVTSSHCYAEDAFGLNRAAAAAASALNGFDLVPTVTLRQLTELPDHVTGRTEWYTMTHGDGVTENIIDFTALKSVACDELRKRKAFDQP